MTDGGGTERPVGGLAVRPPADVELRPASRADLPSVLNLLGQREALGATPIPVAAASSSWESIMGSVDASPFLAVAGGQAAGLLLLFFRQRLNVSTWEAWVPELVVAPEFRSRGIGRALLRVAIEEWRLRGGFRLSVETAPGEDAGEALLTSLGFDPGLLRFRQEPIQPADRRMPAGITIRPLQSDDFEAATKLIAQMGASRVPQPERMEALHRAFDALTARDQDASLVAERDGIVVGICTAEIRQTLRAEGFEGWIPELVVTEQMRGMGIGRALTDAALTELLRLGATGVILESGEHRAAAHALYRSMGFRDAGRERILMRDRA